MSSTPGHRRVPTPILLAVAAVATLAVGALAVVSCGGDDEGSATTTTTAPADGHTAHDDDSAGGEAGYGSHGMAPTVVTPAQLGELGAGPAAGATFAGTFGLNVCGRFLDSPAAGRSATTGWSTDGTGRFSVTPPDDAHAGRQATIGGLMELIGVELSTGSVTFPTSTAPAQFQVGTASTAIAGATFGPDSSCGDTPARVQVWVYDAHAVATGEQVRAVEVDPQDTPVIEEGMAFVVTVTPESSLPTLPPSAMAG